MATLASVLFTGTNGDPWGAETTAARSSGVSAATIDTNRGKIVTSAAGSYADGLVRRLSYGTRTDGDIYFTFEVPTLNEAFGQLWFRADSTCGVNGYFFSMEPSYNNLRFYRRVSSVQTALGSNVAFTFVANTVYSARVQWSGTTLRAKFWTGSEPGSWTVSTTDATHSGAGYIGLGLEGGAAAAARTAFYDDVYLTDDGVIGVVGGATQVITATSTAAGVVGNAATQTITADATASGSLGASGAATQAITAGGTATASWGAKGGATQAITAGASSSGDASIPRFPLSPLPVTVELYLNGAWTDITEWTYGRDATPITITRGRSAEGGTVERSTCQLSLDNRDGRFSPRNPTGPYLGQLTRNTPLRVTIEEGGPYLEMLEGDLTVASTPDSVALSITGDLDLRVDVDSVDWTSGDLITKFDYATQNSYVFWVDQGRLVLDWRQGGVARQAFMSVDLPITGAGRQAVRVALDVDNGDGQWTARFYTASTIAGPWRQVGPAMTGTTGTTSIDDSTAPVRLGDIGFGSVNGKWYAAEIRDGIDGTVVASPVFSDQIVGAGTFFDDQGNTWTINTAGALTNRHARITGEVSEWPQMWDITGRDAWVPVTASGILRRLGQGQSPVASTLRRTLPTLASLKAYWPCEDGQNAETVGSALTTARAMQVVGAARFASVTSFPSSGALPSMQTARFDGLVPTYASTGENQVRFLLAVPETGTTDLAVVARIWATGTAARWDIVYGTLDGGSLQLNAYDRNGAAILTGGFVDFDLDGARKRISLELTQSGSNINFTLASVAIGAVGGGVTSGTLNSRTAGVVSRVSVNASQNLGDTAIGHITVENDVTSLFDVYQQFNAYRYETAGARLQRLCDENGIELQLVGSAGYTEQMGYQGQKTFVELVKECAATDGGILYEPADRLGLAYRTRATIERQNPQLTLSYPGHQMQILQPIEDDRATRNDITVTRDGGGSSRATLSTGAMSILSPPNGVGRYDSSTSLSLAYDADATEQAYWRLGLGTVDEARYPVLTVSLASSAFTVDPGLVREAITLTIGDRIVVEDPPLWVPPDPISQIVQGYTEKLGQFQHDITWNLAPESPYRVAIYDDTESRYSSDGTEAAIAHDSTTAALVVVTPSGPTWTDEDGDFDVMVGGERMTVTAVTDYVNLISNPSVEVNDTGWANFSANATRTRETSTGYHGAAFERLTWTGAGGKIGGLYLPSPAVTVGHTYTSTLYVRTNISQVIGMTIEWKDAGSSIIGTTDGPDVSLTANTWTQITATGAAPVSAVTATPTAYVRTAGVAWTAGNTLDADAGRFYLGSEVIEYPLEPTGREQTLTVTRSVNGVVKAHSAGAAVELFAPVYYSL